MIETTKKIILSGNVSVGKTSLVNRYLRGRFLEKYPTSIGVRIDRREIPKNDRSIDVIIWDLASESSQQNVPQAYFIKVEGVIYVVDISEPSTFTQMSEDVTFLKEKLPNAPILIVANKSDKLSPEEIGANIQKMPLKPDLISSAKNNYNVDAVFDRLVQLMLL